jgi:alpha-mannosidase
MRVTCLALVLAVGTVSSFAQRGAAPPKNPLAPAALAKLHVLETLGELPPVEWHIHPGDLPHGEDPTLNIASWATVSAHGPKGDQAKLGTGAAWIRQTIVLPKQVNGYDIAGARIWFQARINARGPMTSIIYVNGNRVALGEDLEPIVLTESAKPGETFVIAVKALDTVLPKSFQGATMHVDPMDPKRPNPEDVREQCLAASELLPYLPTPRPDLLPKVTAAVDAIDVAALKHGDNAAFDASLRKSQAILDGLHEPLSAVTMNMVGNSHIDAAWLWPKTETVDIVHRTFDTAIQLMKEYPNYKYTQSAAQYSQWMADKYPDLNKQIAARIKEGRWEIVGGMWIEPDLNLPGGESIVRQLLVGQRSFHDLYGVVAKIGWNPDTFGYNWQMPQIYKRSGLDYFVTQKMGWNDTNQLPLRLFWWQGLDGSKILTYFPTGYAHRDAEPGRLGDDFAASAVDNPKTVQYADLYGVGDHGGGPTRMMLDEAEHWIGTAKSTQDATPKMRYSTMQEFFDSVQPHLNSQSPVWDYAKLAKGWTAPAAGSNGEMGIPTWNDELYLEKHRGTYTTQAMHKWYMRHSEDDTIDAEKFASVAWLDGTAYPGAQFMDSWKAITFNQFHDLAAGSGIGVIYKDAQKEYDVVFASDHATNEASHKDIAARVDTVDSRSKDSVPVLVWNTLSWPRSETVDFSLQLPDGDGSAVEIMDAAGKSYPYEIVTEPSDKEKLHIRARIDDVPATGYKLLHVHASQQKPVQDKANEAMDQGANFVLTNGKLKVVVRKSDGCVTSVTEKGVEFLASNACANQLQTVVDNPKQFDAWDIDPGTYDVPPTNIDKVDSVELVHDGLLRKTVRVTRSWSKSKFTEDISLDAGADYVVFDNTVDWQETHILLKAAFPLAATGPKATYEIPFGAIQRETTRDNSFTKARFEVPAQRWADLGDAKQGVSLLNDAKYGYDALGNVLRLTLLRSPVDPDPLADRGTQHMRYALYPHTGMWQSAQTVHRGYEFDDPMTAEQVFAHAGPLPSENSFASVDNTNVVLAAVKKAEDAHALIFRVYETSGLATEVKLHVPAGATGAQETNLMETPETAKFAVRDNTISFPLKPFEIRTIEVAYPAK